MRRSKQWPQKVRVIRLKMVPMKYCLTCWTRSNPQEASTCRIATKRALFLGLITCVLDCHKFHTIIPAYEWSSKWQTHAWIWAMKEDLLEEDSDGKAARKVRTST